MESRILLRLFNTEKLNIRVDEEKTASVMSRRGSLFRKIVPLGFALTAFTMLSPAACAEDVTFKSVKATPRYPWSDKVDFVVEMSGALPEGAGITVSRLSGDEGTPIREWYSAPVSSASGDATLMKFTVDTGRRPPVLAPGDTAPATGGTAPVDDGEDEEITDTPFEPYIVTVDEIFYADYMVVQTITGDISFFKNYSDVTNRLLEGDCIVLRRIPAERYSFGKGEKGEILCDMTRQYYIGESEISQDQWQQVMATSHSSGLDFSMSPPTVQTISDRARIPVYNVSYVEIRGAPSLVDWPNNRTVAPTSFMGVLRQKTHTTGFDLPTEAQWQVACMGGSTAPYNGLNIQLGLPASGSVHYTSLDQLGRYLSNQIYPNRAYPGVPYPDHCVSVGCVNQNLINGFTFVSGPNEVCSYTRNDFNIFDMHGNVREWCLDWYDPNIYPSSQVDPVGPTNSIASASGRVVRGGGWRSIAEQCAASYRDFLPDTMQADDVGFRVAYNVPAETQLVSYRNRIQSPIGPGRDFHTASGDTVELPYNTAWNNAEAVVIRINGAEVFSSAAPAEGSFAWETAGLAPGDYMLELDDGVETLTAVCHLEESPAPPALEELTFGNVKATPRSPWNGKIDFEVDVNCAAPVEAGISVRSVTKDGTPLHEWYHAPIPKPVDGVAHLVFTVDTWGTSLFAGDSRRPVPTSSCSAPADVTGRDEMISDGLEITIDNAPYDYMIVSTTDGSISFANGWANVDGRGSLGDIIILCRIPSGTFRLDETACLFHSGETNLCTISRPFYMGLCEVNQDQWQQVMKHAEHPSATDYTLCPAVQTTGARGRIPVYNVSYVDIRGGSVGGNWPNSADVDSDSFMGVLRDKTGRTGFDLPTEVQWQVACMGGWQAPFNRFDYPHVYWISSLADIHHDGLDLLGRYFSNQIHPNGFTAGTCFDPSLGCTNQSAISQFVFTHGPNKVCSYVRNGYDLYDMHGNVREWCLDWYDPEHWPSSAVDATGPAEPVTVFGRQRIVRGGGWNSGTMDCRAAARDFLPEGCKTNDVGFRVAYNLPRQSYTLASYRLGSNLLSNARPGFSNSEGGSVALPYDTAWNNAASVTIRVDGEQVFAEGAPASGVFTWDTAELSPGVYTLELDDGVEVSTVKYLVKISPEDERARTQTTEVPVPYSWLASQPLFLMAAGNDFEQAAKLMAFNEKHTLEQCFVAGLLPDDPEAEFRADIKVTPDGTVKVTPCPDRGEERLYTVEGKENLKGDWEPVDYARHRFFRIKVSMP